MGGPGAGQAMKHPAWNNALGHRSVGPVLLALRLGLQDAPVLWFAAPRALLLVCMVQGSPSTLFTARERPVPTTARPCVAAGRAVAGPVLHLSGGEAAQTERVAHDQDRAGCHCGAGDHRRDGGVVSGQQDRTQPQ